MPFHSPRDLADSRIQLASPGSPALTGRFFTTEPPRKPPSILDLIDRVPEELWNEVHDIVQETGSRPSPWKRNARKQNGCLGRHGLV